MSTRCQIGIYENRKHRIQSPAVLLYRHSDGYPDTEHGVLALIVPFLKRFEKTRGIDDTEYCGAWLMYELIDNAVKYRKRYYREEKKQNPGKIPYVPRDGKNFLGFGICDGEFHGDIEYYYRINPNLLKNGKVTAPAELLVYKCFGSNPDSWKLIDTILLG